MTNYNEQVKARKERVWLGEIGIHEISSNLQGLIWSKNKAGNIAKSGKSWPTAEKPVSRAVCQSGHNFCKFYLEGLKHNKTCDLVLEQIILEHKQFMSQKKCD